MEIGVPTVSEDRLALHEKYHRHQAREKDWPFEGKKDPEDYLSSFALNPTPVEEWRYYLGSHCIGIGYVDSLPRSLSMIYFFYDPDYRDRSLGVFNVLQGIDQAKQRGLPFLYTGYYVRDCPSLSYKDNFQPNEGFIEGQWQAHSRR